MLSWNKKAINRHLFVELKICIDFIPMSRHFVIYIIISGPVITRFKACCFELVLWDASLVWFPVWRNFRPVYGIGANSVMIG
jgi:hypothetical protein